MTTDRPDPTMKALQELKAAQDQLAKTIEAVMVERDGYRAALRRIDSINGSSRGPSALVQEFKHIARTALGGVAPVVQQ